MSTTTDPVQAILKGRDLMTLEVGELWNLIDALEELRDTQAADIERLKAERDELAEQVNAKFRL